jgi:gliding motility-associated-like protein
MRKLIFLLALLAFYQIGLCQNLVSNPSFETVTAEPFWGCEITNATGWLNPANSTCPTNTGATPDLFSTFSAGQAVLPNSFMGTTNAHTGNRIAGIVTYHQQLGNYREYLMTQLAQPLVPGQLYRVSFWTTGGNPVEYIYHTNNIGLYFSNTALTQTGYNLISGITPNFNISTVVANSLWTYYEFFYTPTAPVSYFSVGNFSNDANTTTQNFGQNRPYAYYFFDDFEIITWNDSVTTQADTAICSGQPLNITAQGSINGQYSWYITGTPGTIIDNDSILNVIPTSTTTYVVQGAASDDTITVTVNPTPIFTLGNDTTICQGQSVTLNPGIAGATYLWSTGAVTQTITVNIAGIYWLSVTQAGCSWVDTINISILNPPAPINIGNDTAICFGQSVTLSTGIASTLWSTGVTAVQISVNTVATYWASVTNICGTEADTMLLAVNPAPVFTLGNDTTICQGQSVNLDPGIAGASYLWSTGAVTQAIGVNAAGTYWLSVTQAGCSWVDTINVSVLTPPQPFSLGNDTTICQGESVVLNTGLLSTVWSTGVTDSTITVNATGAYWGVISNICGTVSDTVNITVNPLPVFNLGNDTTICSGQGVTLDPGIAGATYGWSTSDVTQTISVNTTGSYSLTVTQSGCTWADTINVTVLNPPQPFTLGNDTAICAGQTLTLATGVSATVWSTGVTASQIVVSTSGIFVGTVSNICGTEADTIIVAVNPLPVVSLGNDTALCTGDVYVLDVTNSATTYQWQDNSVSGTYTVLQQGTYSVTVTENGCSASDAVTVTYQSIPQFLLGDDTALCVGDALILSPFTGTNPVWQDGSTDSLFTVFNGGVYAVTVQTACGIASDSIIIDYDYCDCYLTIPTAFSPNGDGLNDRYRPIYRCPIEKFMMRIHNRWGEVVFETNDITEGWDGTYQNTPQPISAFVWYIQYTDPYTDKEVFMSGNVTLVR